MNIRWPGTVIGSLIGMSLGVFGTILPLLQTVTTHFPTAGEIAVQAAPRVALFGLIAGLVGWMIDRAIRRSNASGNA